MNLKDLDRPTAALVQQGLKSLGHYAGTCRGYPGPKTQAAYEKYLGDKGPKGGFAEAFAKAAESQIGQKEVGKNGGPAVRKYQKTTWLPVKPWPWCAAFVCWCFVQASKEAGTSLKRPRTAGAWDFENWARKAGAKLIKPASRTKVKRGDIVIFTFSHIGIAVEDEHKGSVRTVEGNTNGAGSREGDGVYRKFRPKSKIRSIIRFA